MGKLLTSLALVAAVLAGPQLAPASNHFGSIGGTVTDENGDPIEGVCVHTTHFDGSYAILTETDALGRYEFEYLTPGEYRLAFEDCLGDGYDFRWYDGKTRFEDATVIDVGPDQHVTGIDETLVPMQLLRTETRAYVGTSDPGRIGGCEGWPVGIGGACVHVNASDRMVHIGVSDDNLDLVAWEWAFVDADNFVIEIGRECVHGRMFEIPARTDRIDVTTLAVGSILGCTPATTGTITAKLFA